VTCPSRLTAYRPGQAAGRRNVPSWGRQPHTQAALDPYGYLLCKAGGSIIAAGDREKAPGLHGSSCGRPTASGSNQQEVRESAPIAP